MRQKEFKEGLGDLAHKAERDHEVQMARADLYKIAKYAIQLHELLKGVSEEEGLQGWQQAKITKASDYISSVYHSLDYDMKFGDGQKSPEIKDLSYESKIKEAFEDRLKKKVSEAGKLKGGAKDPCWKGYKMVGTKKKGGKKVPNCVPRESIEKNSDIQQADAYNDAVNKAIAAKQMTFINPKTGKEEPVMNQRMIQKFGGDEAAATAYFKYTMQYPLTPADKQALRPWLDKTGNLMRKRTDQFTPDERKRYGLDNRK